MNETLHPVFADILAGFARIPAQAAAAAALQFAPCAACQCPAVCTRFGECAREALKEPAP